MTAETLTSKERDVLARHLYDVEGFHAADSWATETPIARGRYEALAEALDGSRWLSGVLAAREQALREEIARDIEEENDSFGVSEDPYGGSYDSGVHEGLTNAARIVRGGAR